MVKYIPGAVTDQYNAAHLADELRRISVALQYTNRIPRYAVEPAKPENGDVIYAIDPLATTLGSGAGLYAREEGAWVKL